MKLSIGHIKPTQIQDMIHLKIQKFQMLRYHTNVKFKNDSKSSVAEQNKLYLT